jgi:3,4-dihydroxy-9,10-secoandrosta-1,3,5(10)-triene-9,17-dione 4,5-dioxygenase
MNVHGLGYIVIHTTDLEAWRRFGTETLGLMLSDREGDSGALDFRTDERPLRIRVEAADRDGLAGAGWEVATSSDFDATVEALKQRGVATEMGSEALRESRCAQRVACFRDPAGNPHELYHGTIYDHRPFVSPVGGSGFVTGDLGLGHVVLPCPEIEAGRTFFEQALGFRLSDELRQGPIQLAFMRCNPRHHSLALASFDMPTGLVHFMLELATLDDVGYALDRALSAGCHLSATLGKHTNDQMISFYVRSPSGFDVEVGWGGVHVDEATWTTGEITAPSFWGHRWDYGSGA